MHLKFNIIKQRYENIMLFKLLFRVPKNNKSQGYVALDSGKGCNISLKGNSPSKRDFEN